MKMTIYLLSKKLNMIYITDCVLVKHSSCSLKFNMTTADWYEYRREKIKQNVQGNSLLNLTCGSKYNCNILSSLVYDSPTFRHDSGSKWHLHAPVHKRLDLRHLHRSVLHLVLQEHAITSMQLSGTAGRDISSGVSFPSTSFHPNAVGSGKLGYAQHACNHTIAW